MNIWKIHNNKKGHEEKERKMWKKIMTSTIVIVNSCRQYPTLYRYALSFSKQGHIFGFNQDYSIKTSYYISIFCPIS